MDKYIGRLLDNRYEILEVIGVGGMAVVYKARCHRLNRFVAIKILKDDFMEDEEFRRRFHSESQAVAMLSHPNIVSVYDVSTSPSADYIVMELIDGITLKQYMEKKGVLNWKETLHFAIQIGKALEHAHSRGIVHRDIKPHNIMVLKNGSVKVTDFGIARMMSQGNTLTKEALGSVHYISPEQAKGVRVDDRSDIYSLGVVMYEMMSGRPPYDGESAVAIAIKHINGGAASPSTLNPNIPVGLEQIIMKAMENDADKRFKSATQMLKDMDEFRKSPVLLFDYNAPISDEAGRYHQNSGAANQLGTKTTAEKMEQRRTGDNSGNRRPPVNRPQRRPEDVKRRSPQGKQEKKVDKSANVATVAIIACSLVMVVAIVIFLVVLLSGGAAQKPELVNVPDLVGKEYEQLPDYENFIIRLNERVYNNEFPEGQIISQTPEADALVDKNTEIYVNVSMGKKEEPVFMPDAVNQEEKQIKNVLKNLQLDLWIETVTEFSDDIPEGNIIRTEPEANSQLEVRQEIILYDSAGPEIKKDTMRDVCDGTKENAIKILEALDLKLEIAVEEVFDSVTEVGCVVRTDPQADAELKTGQKVTLYISKGAEMAKVPSVTGLDIIDAIERLTKSGFRYDTVFVESKEEKNTVLSQSVEKNTEVEVNTIIILEVSKGSGSTPDVIKDVVIELGDSTLTSDCSVKIMRGSEIVFEGIVPKGQQNVTLKNQSGTGKVIYHVIIAEEGKDVEVNFDAQ